MVKYMFGKIINLIVKWISGSPRKSEKHRERSSKMERKKNEYVEPAPMKKYTGVFGAFQYMNTRAEEVNFGSSVTHEWMRGISARVRDACSKPKMALLLVLLPLLYVFSPKAMVVVPLLVILGAIALVVQ